MSKEKENIDQLKNGQKTEILHKKEHPLSSERYIEAAEMIERAPSWLLKWGVISLGLIFLILISVSIFIKYPDTLEGGCLVTSYPPALKITPYVNGRIANIFVVDGDKIDRNSAILELENNTGLSNVYALERYIKQVLHSIALNDNTELRNLIIDSTFKLSDGQNYLNQLQQNIQSYLLLTHQDIYSKQINILKEQIQNFTTLSNINDTEKSLLRVELAQTNELFSANEKLYADKVISKVEYFEEVEQLNEKKILLENKKKEKIQNNISVKEYKKQISDIENEAIERKQNLLLAIQESVYNLNNYIESWKRQYIISAPFNGTFYFSKFLQPNQMINAMEDIGMLVANKPVFIGNVTLSSSGAGKIKIGQLVQIMLDQYPYNEFGYIEGKVKKISVFPQKSVITNSDATYQIYVTLSDSLVTTYNVPIPFLPEMPGKARIITNDRSLLERLISSMRHIKN